MSSVRSCTGTELHMVGSEPLGNESGSDSGRSVSEVAKNESDAGGMSTDKGLIRFENIVQTLILVATLCAAYFKLSESYFDVFKTCGIILLIFILLVVITSRDSDYKYEITYSIYIPFMSSLTLSPSLTAINTLLSLNVINQPLPLKVLTQFTVSFLMNYNSIHIIVAILINTCFAKILEIIGGLKSLDIVDCNLFSILITNVFYLIDLARPVDQLPSIYFKVSQGTLLSLAATILLNFIISKFIKTCFPSFKYTHSLILVTVLTTCFPLLTQKFITISDSQSPLLWLMNYIQHSTTRQIIFMAWLTFVITLVPTFVMFQSKFSLNTSRKIWHFLIFLMISIPFKFDPNFVKIALSGTISLFLCIEYLRYLKLEPIGSFLDSTLSSYADFRDARGPLIISYIYLILGIAFPLLVFNSPAGLISLGVGDSLASIVGKKIGKLYWPNTSKTVEGTLAFVFSTFIVSLILRSFLNYFQDISSLTIFIMCLLSGILEGNSTLNDNILIPLFMVICERIFA